MALTIPDYANATFPEQAGPDSVDFDAIVAGINSTFVAAGLAVTQRAAGANLSVDIAAGVIGIGSVILSVSSGNVAVTADVTNPRWALISVTNAGVLTATLGTAATTPVFPLIPASSVPLAAVWIPANAASILNANIVDKRVTKTAPEVVSSGASGSPVITSYGRTAVEVRYGVDIAGSQFGDSAAGDWVTRLADTTKTIRWGVSAVAGSSQLRLTNTALTLPSGIDMVIGTKATKTGIVALAATANTATALGQFSSTAGSVALRLHLHLITGTVQRTKTYEFVVDTTTDTTNTYYKVLPADQSTAQSATSDVFLVCTRPSTATTTWQFWICTSGTFASTGAITWAVESYGDSLVTFASTLSPATAAPTLPFAGGLHPSNSLDTVAGQVGIGTDAPGAALDITGGTTTSVRVNGGSIIGSLQVSAASGAYSTFGAAGSSTLLLDATANDTLIAGPGTIRLGGSSLQSTLRITSYDAQIYDGISARTVPRGAMFAPTHDTTVRTLSTTLATYVTVHTAPSTTYRANRRYRLEFTGAYIKSSASGGNNAYDVKIMNGATELGGQTCGSNASAAAAYCASPAWADWVPGVDTTVALTVQAAQTVGTVTAASTLNAGTGAYYTLTATDVGA